LMSQGGSNPPEADDEIADTTFRVRRRTADR